MQQPSKHWAEVWFWCSVRTCWVYQSSWLDLNWLRYQLWWFALAQCFLLSKCQHGKSECVGKDVRLRKRAGSAGGKNAAGMFVQQAGPELKIIRQLWNEPFFSPSDSRSSNRSCREQESQKHCEKQHFLILSFINRLSFFFLYHYKKILPFKNEVYCEVRIRTCWVVTLTSQGLHLKARKILTSQFEMSLPEPPAVVYK